MADKKSLFDNITDFSRNFSKAFSTPKQKPTPSENTVLAKTGSGLGKAAGTVWDNFILNPKNLNMLGGNPITKKIGEVLPEVKWSENIPNSPGLIDDAARFAVSIPQEFVNAPGNTWRGFQSFTENVGKNNYTTQQALADLAKTSELPLTLATLGQFGFAKSAMENTLKKNAGKSLLSRALKVGAIGAKEGALSGTLYGLKGGLENNRDTTDLKDYLVNVGSSTATGAVAGGVLGGALSAGGYYGGQKFNQLLTDRKSKNFFKLAFKNQSEYGYSPEAIKASIVDSKLNETEFGKVIMKIADEAIDNDKAIKFVEASSQADNAIRVGKIQYKGAIELVDYPKTLNNITDAVTQSSRPLHQQALEAAMQAGDKVKIKEILDNIPESDPYKGTMESLFRPIVESDQAIKQSAESVLRNPVSTEARNIIAQVDAGDSTPTFVTKNLEKILKENGVSDIDIQTKTPNELINLLRDKAGEELPSIGVDRVVFRATDSVNPHAVLGDGIYVGNAPSTVQKYGDKIERFIVDKNAKIADLQNPQALQSFQDQAISKYRDEFNNLIEMSGGDKAIGEIMRKYAKDLGYDGIQGDDVAFGTVIFNDKVIRPDTSVPQGISTVESVQRQIGDLAKEVSPTTEALSDPKIVSDRLKNDPQSIVRQASDVLPEAPATPVKAIADQTVDESIKSGTYGVRQIGEVDQTPMGIMAKAKHTFDKIYDGMVDSNEPIFRNLREAGASQESIDEIRLKMTGYYGLGSKAKGRLDSQFYPIIKEADKTVGLDNFREYLIDMGNIERGSYGTAGYVDKVMPSQASLDNLANRLGSEKMLKLEELANRWYAYHRDNLTQLVDANVLTPDYAVNSMNRNQFYVHFDRAINKVDDIILDTYKPSNSVGSISRQDLVFTIKGYAQDQEKIRDPIQSAIIDTFKVQQLIERNKIATAVTDEYQKVGLARQVTSAANKIKRDEIYTELKNTKGLRNKVERTLKTLTNQGRRLAREKDNLAKETISSVKSSVKNENALVRKNDKLLERTYRTLDTGEQALLESEAVKPMLQQLDASKRYSKKIANRLLKEINNLNQQGIDKYLKQDIDIDGSKLAKDLNLEQSVTGALSEGKKLSSGQVRKLVRQFTELSPDGIDAIKKKIGRLDPQLDEAIDNFVSLSVATKNIKDNQVFQKRSVESILKTISSISKNSAQENLDILSRQATLPSEIEGTLNKKQALKLFEDLLTMDGYNLGRFRQRLGTLDDKMAKLFEDIDTYKTTLNQINQARSALWDEAKMAKDASTRGLSVIYKMKDGIKEAWEVPPDVAEAMKGMTAKQFGAIAGFFNPMTKIFRATATGINPEFAVPNIVRDAQSAYVNFGVNPLDWVKGFTHYIKKDDMYDKFIESGGRLSRTTVDRNFLQEELESTLGKKGGIVPEHLKKLGVNGKVQGRGILIDKINAAPKALLKILQNIGDASEQPTRLAAFEKIYTKAIKDGIDPSRASEMGAYAAQEASANFARHGTMSLEMNAIYAFLNARIQGLDRVVRTFKENPAQTSRRLATVVLAPALAAYAWNRLFPSYYDENVVSETDKRDNWIIMLADTPLSQFGGAQYLKLPKGDIGKLANAPEAFFAWLDNEAPDGSGQIANAFASSLAAFSPVDINFSLGPLGALGNIVSPTAVQPIVEAALNKAFHTGYDIVPECKKNYPKDQQIGSYTSPMYVWAAERLNALLPDEIGPDGKSVRDTLGIAPATLQHLVEGYTTGIGKITNTILSPAFEGMGYAPAEQKGADINRTPIVRRFLGGEKKNPEEAATSYERQANSIDYQIKDIKSGIKRGDIPEDAGYKRIDGLLQRQDSLYQKMDQAQGIASNSNGSIATASDGKGLVPSAYAEVNPDEISTLLKQKERKDLNLERWALNPTEQRAQQLGLDYEESKMWLLAKLPDDEESVYITKDIFAQKDAGAQDEQALKYIVYGRLTDAKINKSLRQGEITKTQAEHLKDLIDQYEISVGLKNPPKAKKIKTASIAKVSTKVPSVASLKLPTIKLSGVRGVKIKPGSLSEISSGKFGYVPKIKGPNINLSDYQSYKVKTVKPAKRVSVR